MSRIVIALGGNALGDSPAEQIQLVRETAKPLVDLIEAGHELIIVHGNGPQVGMIHRAFQLGAAADELPHVGLTECGAMSQGYIGFHLQNALQNELTARQNKKSVVSVITQVLVDPADSGFANPTKPIGAFYTAEEADALSKQYGYQMIEDSGRGYRRVIASPQPQAIIEQESIVELVGQGNIVICLGGGGIPVVREEERIVGVEAVIDKDRAAELLAKQLAADIFIVLTAVDRVAIRYGQPDQLDLAAMTVAEAQQYIEEGHFAPGSMLPKVEACVAFVESGANRTAIIASLDKAALAIEGLSGTKIRC